MSGGQRRRAFLARALAAEPELYLLDEPVTGVDIPTQHDLMALLAAEAERGRTVIATTHDLAAVERHFEQAVGCQRPASSPAGPAAIVDDPDVLSRTYGGHLLMIGNQAVLLDDAHHHDTPSGGEQHYHEEDRRR